VRTLRQIQFTEDAGAMAHPVRPDSYVEINNFYTPTVYEKGAEVVRMMHTLVDRDGFAAGMRLYFERHDGQAVTCDDFAQAIADANPASELALRLPQFKRWYAQAGTPRVQARGRFDAAAGTYTLALSQRPAPGHDANQPHVVPIKLGLLDRDGRALAVQLDGEPAGATTERVLVLDDTQRSWTFVGLAAEPVPSLLRGFSAPVILDDGLDDADLLVRLQHDTDPFNRWDAGQRLALGRLLTALRDGNDVALDAPFLDAMRGVLRHTGLDAAFKDLLLTPPSESYVAEQVAPVDPQRIHTLRESMRLQLAQALRDDWVWAFEQHQVAGAYSPDPVASGRRALANQALAMLCLDAANRDDSVWPGRAYQRFKDAANMTDRLGALAALVDSHAALAEPALAQFHQLFSHEPLVLDKWFALQAWAPEKDGRVFERARALLGHPDFHLANPNRARSLISALCGANPGAFHRHDGAGYAFWADRVLELDALNPQLAARVARVMDRWSKLAEPYRSPARAAVARVATQAVLSNDVREIVSRALASGD